MSGSVIAYICSIFVIDLIAVVIWISILAKMDRYHKDKRTIRSLIIFFIFGGLSVPLTFLLYRISDPFWAYLYTSSYEINSFLYEFVFVGPIEEFSKFIVFYIIVSKTKSVTEPRDGVLQAASVALAFAAVENFKYGLYYGFSTILLRSVLTIAGHMTYTVIWSFFYSAVEFWSPQDSKSQSLRFVLMGLIIGSFLHGLYNFLIDIGHSEIAIFLDASILIVAIYAYNYLGKQSPFSKLPLSQYKIAIPRIKLALERHPKSVTLNFRIAMYYLYAKQYQMTLNHLAACIKNGAKKAFINFIKGLTLFLSGEEEKGREMMIGQYLKGSQDQRRRYRKAVKSLVSEPGRRDEVLEYIGESERVRGKKYPVKRISRQQVLNRAGIPYRVVLDKSTAELKKTMGDTTKT